MDDTPPTLNQKLSAEAIGTGVLVFLGCGSAAVLGNLASGELAAFAAFGSIASIGLTFGIAIVAMVYAFGRISGGHFNPAVSVGVAMSGRMSWKDAGLYSLAQIVGGIVGGLLLALTLITSDVGYSIGDDSIGANGFGDRGGVELGGALIIEIILTAIFVLVILAVTDKRGESNAALAPLTIGLTLAAIHFVGIPATGTSVNPARSLGPVFFAGGDAIAQIWLFIVAPLVGAALIGFVYPLIFGRDADPVPGSGLDFGSGQAAPGFGAGQFQQQQWGQDPNAGMQQGMQPGMQQGMQQGYAQPAAAMPAAPEQPIIQDGWMWDAQAQQWVPAPQSEPAPPAAPAPAPEAGSWPNPAGPEGAAGQTQVRPPDA